MAKPTALSPYFRSGTPVSGEYGDIYFDQSDGEAEKTHVFLKASGFSERIKNLDKVSVAEIGFGSGLNFFLCLSEIRKQKLNVKLNFLSVDKCPPSPEFSLKALERFSIIPIAEEFYRDVKRNGSLMVYETKEARAEIVLNEATEFAKELTEKPDFWFFDGFSPKVNPDAWSEELILETAKASKPGSILSSYSSASEFRKNLSANGFDVEKIPGFRKREMIRAVFQSQHG